jgi:hypothetical protein
MSNEPSVHLFRGAPCVRSWSKYQTTVERWIVYGIKRATGEQKGAQDAAPATTDPSVSCRFCRQPDTRGSAPCNGAEPDRMRRWRERGEMR